MTLIMFLKVSVFFKAWFRLNFHGSVFFKAWFRFNFHGSVFFKAWFRFNFHGLRTVEVLNPYKYVSTCFGPCKSSKRWSCPCARHWRMCGSGGITPPALNFGSSSMWVVWLTHRLLYPKEENPTGGPPQPVRTFRCQEAWWVLWRIFPKKWR